MRAVLEVVVADIANIRDVRRDMYRQQVMAAAEVEFARAGFDKTKVSDIARTADLSLGTVYKTFDGKDAIWNALNRQRLDEFVAYGRSATAGIASPLERVLSLARAEFVFFAEHADFLRLHLAEGLSWATAQPEVGRGSQRDTWRTGIDLLVGLAEEVVASNEARPMRPTVLAGLVISALQVWLSDWLRSGSDRSADEAAAEMVDYLRNALTAGVNAVPST